MGIVDRVKLKLNEMNMSIKGLEKELGIGNGTIAKWDTQTPRADKLILVANYLSISLDWLILGKESGSLTVEEQELIEAYRLADPRGRGNILVNAKREAELNTNLGKLSDSQTG